jgi:hypothetical protein
MSTDQTILDEAKENYKIAVDGWQHIYDEAKEDLAFVYDVGQGQWPAEVRKARGTRPIITVNKLQKFVRQIRGDMMQNRPRIKVIPVDNKADVQMAGLYNDLIRQIEYLSSAEIAYDTAYGHAVACSVGYFRLITDYAEDTSFKQDIYIKRIINPFAVHFDPRAVEFNMEDAQFCFFEDRMTKKEFERRYKGAEAANFDGLSETFGDWLNNDDLRIAEYFWKEPVKTEIVQLRTGEVLELNKKVTVARLKAAGGEIVKNRTVDSHKVMWCKMTGTEILEQSEWSGYYIPIIPVFGDEIVADGKRFYLSATRGAKGPQQMYNYWATAATENVAMSPKAPFILEARQIKGFEREWDDANVKNAMYIRYHAIAGLNKPQREQQTQVPVAIIGMLQSTAYDIEDHLGRYEASKGQASNERSGVAIKERVAQSDKGTYTFVDNMTRAVIYAGRQIIDLIPKVYDTKRALQIMGENGEHQVVNVNVPTIGPDGKPALENDLSVGTYDIVATVGASSSSKRQEMVAMMTDSMQYAPSIAPIIAPLIFKYSDWPGAEEVYQELKKSIEQQQMMAAAQGGGTPAPTGAVK